MACFISSADQILHSAASSRSSGMRAAHGLIIDESGFCQPAARSSSLACHEISCSGLPRRPARPAHGTRVTGGPTFRL